MSQLYDVIKIEEDKSFNITGRGITVIVNLDYNNMTHKRKELQSLLNSVVEIEGQLFKVLNMVGAVHPHDLDTFIDQIELQIKPFIPKLNGKI